jgi:hypothetical protein
MMQFFRTVYMTVVMYKLLGCAALSVPGSGPFRPVPGAPALFCLGLRALSGPGSDPSASLLSARVPISYTGDSFNQEHV